MKAKFIYEALDFERGQDPKEAMSIGSFSRDDRDDDDIMYDAECEIETAFPEITVYFNRNRSDSYFGEITPENESNKTGRILSTLQLMYNPKDSEDYHPGFALYDEYGDCWLQDDDKVIIDADPVIKAMQKYLKHVG